MVLGDYATNAYETFRTVSIRSSWHIWTGKLPQGFVVRDSLRGTTAALSPHLADTEACPSDTLHNVSMRAMIGRWNLSPVRQEKATRSGSILWLTLPTSGYEGMCSVVRFRLERGSGR